MFLRTKKGPLKVGLALCSCVTLFALAGCGPQATPAASGAASLAAAFPANWSMDAAGPEHNAAFATPSGAPAGLLAGYCWRFAEIHAQPLNQLPPDADVAGRLRASVRTTQSMGNALGVTAVGGIIYAESDSGAVYALNAATGKQIWERTFPNEVMGNPVVEHGLVFIGMGNTNFSFRELMNYKSGQPVMRGTGMSGIFALNAKTGKTVWRRNTLSEDMPTPAYLQGTLFEANGDGNVLALTASTGKLLWKKHIGGFDSMSSPVAWVNPQTKQGEVVASFSNPDQVVALAASDGKKLWTQTVKGSFDTGLSDEVPTVDPQANVVVVNSVVNPKTVGGKLTTQLAVEALNGTTGKVLWYDQLGRGSMPPAFKAGVPMIHKGVIYMNAPATDTMHAIDLASGHVLWGFKSKFPGRAAPTYYRGTLYFADGPFIYALNPASGHLIHQFKAGGLFGIVNPVIVGGTVYMDSSYDWVMAIPLKKINPQA